MNLSELLRNYELNIVFSLPQRFYKKAAAFVLRAVAKHSAQLAQVSEVNDCLHVCSAILIY